jgi:ferredoxin
MCGGCLGECPYGVLRSDLLRIVMYHEGYQNGRLIKEDLEKIKLSENIRLCSECSSCSVVCRRGLDMKAQMRLAEQILS